MECFQYISYKYNLKCKKRYFSDRIKYLPVKVLVFFTCLISFLSLSAQPNNWFLLDKDMDHYYGTSVNLAYQTLLKDKNPDTIIVAVVDGGVDPYQEDLKRIMWHNPKEIPANLKDDDKNGHIDDIYGWNFLGNPDGQDVNGDTYEVTRRYIVLKKMFDGIDSSSIKEKQKKEYAEYKNLKDKVETSLEFAKRKLDEFEMTITMIDAPMSALEKRLKDTIVTSALLDTLDAGDDVQLMTGIIILKQLIDSADTKGKTMTEYRNLVMDELNDAKNHFYNEANFAYNINLDTRKEIVKDKYDDYSDSNYGNADVKGPDASHGTHVAGIIGADRSNTIGIDGIANAVKIMAVRTVPNGDERDKDVANAIRYAVDNGAKVINMSFGKGISPGKKYVDQAVEYAVNHDVLLVHAAGNSNEDNDSVETYPEAKYLTPIGKDTYAKAWIEVGALTADGKPAEFSNFGQKTVDIFAPGENIYSTYPDQKYKVNSGTSMASPMVAGVAAVIRSYFPQLSALQVKDIIMKSAVKIDADVINPKTHELVAFSTLCVSGGYINAYQAIKLAQEMTSGKLK